MSEETKKQFLQLRHEELGIMDELKREPKMVDGVLSFERYMKLHAELREVHLAMASVALS